MYFVFWNQFTGGNEYKHYENISINLNKNAENTYYEIHEELEKLAKQFGLNKHEIILPEHIRPSNTRYFRQEDLKDGVVNVRYIDTEVSQNLNISVNWANEDYGKLYSYIVRFIVDKGYEFSVPHTKIGNVQVSKITKDRILQNNFEQNQ